MSSQSPSSVLYSSDGYELAVVSGSPFISGTRSILFAGNDGTNTRTILIDALARQVVVGAGTAGTPAGGLITIQGDPAMTPVIVNQGTSPWVTSVTGTVAVTQSTSPWVVSGTVTSNQGTPNSLANAWPITITDGYGNIQGSAVNPVYIQGSISATNPSVGADGATALGFDTQVGGKVTTAAPTYTTGNLDALSLTTLGGLRIDGVYVVGTANATAADVGSVGGYVTTAAPTYTTGQLNPLSLTTAGDLRTVANQGTSPWVVSGTGGTFDNRSVGADAATALGFDTQVGGKVTTAAPTYTTGNLDAISLTTLGGLRIDGVYASGTANATAADLMANGGYVTTAAPTYTTGQLAALSLDTAGNLRTTAVTNKAATSAVTSVASSATNTTLLAANTARIFASVYNDSNKQVYIKLGTTASATSYTILLMPNSYWEIPNDYTGQIDAIWTNANGNARVTELSP